MGGTTPPSVGTGWEQRRVVGARGGNETQCGLWWVQGMGKEAKALQIRQEHDRQMAGGHWDGMMDN